MDKRDAYAALVAARKACRQCPVLVNPAAVDGGALDSDRLGPFTLWQGNLDAEVVVVGQDFADLGTFRRVGGWPGARVRTSLALVELLGAAGVAIQPPHRGEPDDRLFFTNAVLCLKEGGMQALVPASCSRACGERFLRPAIELVAPQAVVALGKGALAAVGHAFRLDRPLPPVGAAIDLPNGSRLFAMAHPSPTVRNTSRSFEQQRGDWQRLGEWLAEPAAS